MEQRSLIRLASAVAGVAALVGVVVWWANRPPRIANAPVSSPAIKVPAGVRITVEVINTTTTRGLARRATFVLRDAGFDVVRYTSDSARRDSTLVLARSGHLDFAEAVAKALGGAIRVESRPDSSRYLDVSVFLGTAWKPPSEPFYP